MVNFSYPVKCALMREKEIDMDTCFEIHTVVEGTTPKYIAPKEIFEHRNYKDICLKCKYHRYD